MRSKIKLLLAVAGVFASVMAYCQPVAIPNIGGNLEEIEDFSHSHAFADLVHQSRVFGDPDRPFEPGTVKFDVDGWPTTDFGVILMTDIGDQRKLGGTYKLSCLCAKTPLISLVSGSPGTVQNIKRNATTGIVTADIVFPEGGEQMFLGFKQTGGGVKNLKVMRPGLTTETFNPVFLKSLDRFSTLRFMDWTQTNGNPQVKFADRPLTKTAQWTIKGVPWETIIELGNTLQCNVWVNVPLKANDGYVTSMAKLFKAKLKPNLKVFVEYSNEVWNFGFQQSHDNLDLAEAEVKAGKGDLNFDSANDKFFWAARRIGRRIAQISALFKTVYGDSQFEQRVRPVLATQVAFPELWLDQPLFYISQRVGKPSGILGGVAFAPYFNMGDDQFKDGLSTAQVIAALTKTQLATPALNKYEYNRAKALWFKLPTFAYEGGPDTFGNGSLASKRLANFDPKMRSLVTAYLRDWYSFDFGGFNWYTAGATSWSTPFGSWGLTEDMANQDTPKIFGLDDIINGSPIKVTAGILIPSNVDARKHISRFPDFKTRDPFLRNFKQGDVFDYLVRVDAAGDFVMDATVASESADGLLSLCVDGIRMDTVAVPNTGSMTTFKRTKATSAFSLDMGLHCIRLRIERGSFLFNVKTINVVKR